MHTMSHTNRPTGYGSDRYGPCEICGKHCDSVYILTMWGHGTDEDGDFRFHRGNVFGHQDCLEAHAAKKEA